MDPFEKLFDVDHLIYQHLTGKEVLKLSEVSPAWYSEIGSSSVCMSKIRFNFRLMKGNSVPPRFIDTKRRHANVTIEWERTKKKKTKAIMSSIDRTKLIGKFASSVTYLTIQSMSNLMWEPVCFPKLKKLRFDLSAENTHQCFISPSFMDVVGQCNVENLIANGTAPVEKIFDFVTKRLNSLKTLSLDRWNTGAVFGNNEIATLHQLKLTKLRINIHNKNLQDISNMALFLKSQADTLEHLVLLDATEDMLKAALELPKLKILDIGSYWPNTVIQWSALPTSNSIVDVHLSRYDPLAPNDLQKLLERLPNMKQMTVDELKINQIRVIQRTAMKLETVYIKDNFDNIMKELETLKQNSNITETRKQNANITETRKQNANVTVNHRIQLKRAALLHDLSLF